MVWGIIGALEAEVAHIRKKMDVEKTMAAYGSDFAAGTIDGTRVVLVCSSIGTINAAACTSVLIREFGVNTVINLGIAGAIGRDLSMMDVVVSDEVMFHDKDHAILEKYYPFRRSFQADRRLVEQCIVAMERLRLPVKYRVGRIVSGDIFVNDATVKERIAREFNPLCVEMEGAAVAQIAAMSNVPFLIIRTISDNADSDADKTYDNFLELAANQSSSIALTMIQNRL